MANFFFWKVKSALDMNLLSLYVSSLTFFRKWLRKENPMATNTHIPIESLDAVFSVRSMWYQILIIKGKASWQLAPLLNWSYTTPRVVRFQYISKIPEEPIEICCLKPAAIYLSINRTRLSRTLKWQFGDWSLPSSSGKMPAHLYPIDRCSYIRTLESKSKLLYDWRPVSQSVCLGIEPTPGLLTRYYFLSKGCCQKQEEVMCTKHNVKPSRRIITKQ
jgi:hypothetical protein